MDLDWITLYDYMTIHSQTELKQKINKFYQSFYPLKLKKTSRKKLQFNQIQRGGLLGIIATYITRVLSVLTMYLQAQGQLNETYHRLLAKDTAKQSIKLARMFVQIETQNLAASLKLQKTVYIIQQAYQFYTNKQQQNKSNQDKCFLQMKLLGSLKRLFQFFYSLEQIKNYLDTDGYCKIQSILKLNTMEICQKAMPHFKLFPEIRELMYQILKFFSSNEKQSFNFHAHLTQDNKKGAKLSFGKKLKQTFSIMPNKQKQLFMILTDQNFLQFLSKSKFQVPKQPIQNYFRSQQQINALIAEQQNFLQSILVPQKYRGKPQWKKSVLEQLVNLSSQNRRWQKNAVLASKKFKFSQDFPLINN